MHIHTFFTVGSNNLNIVECTSLRNKNGGTVSNSGTQCGGIYNRSPLLPDTALFKNSCYSDGASTRHVRETLTNTRLLTTTSAEQVFGSLKSLSNTEVNSQSPALSSASCSSTSSLLSSSNCGLIQGKEIVSNTRGNMQNQQQSSQSTDRLSPNHSPKGSIPKSPQRNCFADPPPIPPKISSNINQSNLTDTSPPVIGMSLPEITSNDSSSVQSSKLATDSENKERTNEDSKSLIEEMAFTYNNLLQETVKDGSNKDEGLSQKLENDKILKVM